MSTATIRIPTPLRSFTGGADEVTVGADTVRGALDALGERHDGLIPRILTETGEARPFVNIYLGSKNVKTLDGLATTIADGDVVSIIPAVAGGRS